VLKLVSDENFDADILRDFHCLTPNRSRKMGEEARISRVRCLAPAHLV
jgi:hypothetical protein